MGRERVMRPADQEYLTWSGVLGTLCDPVFLSTTHKTLLGIKKLVAKEAKAIWSKSLEKKKKKIMAKIG